MLLNITKFKVTILVRTCEFYSNTQPLRKFSLIASAIIYKFNDDDVQAKKNGLHCILKQLHTDKKYNNIDDVQSFNSYINILIKCISVCFAIHCVTCTSWTVCKKIYIYV